jgi:16S rRNA (uracil1498-N3)-methyltransferase
MHRLLVPTEVLRCSEASLPPEACHHLKVVRPRAGETVVLFDGCGKVREYCVADPSPRAPRLTASGPVKDYPAPARSVTLFACVTKGSRWDWTIEKAVELGATRIVPVLSERCVVRLTPAERPAKAERWRRIAADAARQSAAVWLPEVAEPVDFQTACAHVQTSGVVLVGALTNPPPPPIGVELERVRTESPEGLGLFVGPEGDFTPDELNTLLALARPVSFGPTVLRAETAAIFGLSVLTAAVQSW